MQNLDSIKSGVKYVYIVVFFVLLSGFFHPLITDRPIDEVVYGTLVLIFGLIGGIIIYKAATQKNTAKIVLTGIGFGMITLSLYFIFLLTGRL